MSLWDWRKILKIWGLPFGWHCRHGAPRTLVCGGALFPVCASPFLDRGRDPAPQPIERDVLAKPGAKKEKADIAAALAQSPRAVRSAQTDGKAETPVGAC